MAAGSSRYTFVVTTLGHNEWSDRNEFDSDEAAIAHAAATVRQLARDRATHASIMVGRGESPDDISWLGGFDVGDPEQEPEWLPARGTGLASVPSGD